MAVLAQDQLESEAFEQNFIHIELLHDGNTILSVTNSKQEETAKTFIAPGVPAHA